MKELIIIGGGAAGLTAGIYAARKYIDTLLISKDFTGQVGTSAWVENYPGFKRISGLSLIKSFKEHLAMFSNIEIRSYETVKKIKKTGGGFSVITDSGQYGAKAVIVASGAAPKKLKVKNEEKFLGKGISYCLTCDETAYQGKAVAVIGGGNAGAEAALELARICPKIYLFEYEKNLNADMILQAEMKRARKIKIISFVKIKSFAGKDFLKKIIYEDREAKEEKEIKVDGCFIEIGSVPNTEFIDGLVKLNNKKEIEIDPVTFASSQPGIFAAGDVTSLPGKQIVIACGQGAAAVLSAYKFLRK